MFLPALLASTLLMQQTAPAPTATPAPVQAPAAAAQTEPATLPTVNVAAAPAQPAQTCRTEAVTGSRFGRRVCRSTVQTAEEAAASREMLRRMQGARMPDS